MASLGQPPAWEELPDEILLQILSHLEPEQLPRLQLVSHRLRDVCLDDELWKRHCFKNSQWYNILKNRRQHRLPKEVHISNIIQDTQSYGLALSDAFEPSWRDMVQLQELQDMANWDPVFRNEKVSWYEEYVQRHGPTCVNWLETPCLRDGGLQMTIEARGMALYVPNNDNDGCGTMMAVSPLDDGSVCLWDVNGSRGRRGGIIVKSRPEILFVDGPGTQYTQRSKKIDTGVTDCVSVDHNNHRAFFAVQSHLVEVDLNRLQVVSRESFEWSITTLSPINDGVPLTVGTSLGIHLHDFRAQARALHDVVERVDGPPPDEDSLFKVIFDTKPLPPYAPLSQPTPINILHLPRPECESAVTDDIYVAGRFSNILHYDRRNFPRIMDSIYSGARLSSLAALPYPFSPADDEAQVTGMPLSEKPQQRGSHGSGWTLIAGGEYKTKGSLEMYGLASATHSGGSAILQKSHSKNRHTAASSTILSVMNHGTRIAFSDGAGLIKWFERDGMTECRRLKIGHSEMPTQSSLFASMPGSDDLARKIVSTKSKHTSQHSNEDDILFWTGEKLGMVSFTGTPLFKAEDFEVQNPEAAAGEAERQEYSDRMREALERQADEARFVRGLGLGS